MRALIPLASRANPTDAGTRVRQRRLLLPKEHGAYFQLAVPVATALAMGHPTTSAVLFALAAAALFLGHESLLVVIGARGRAALRDDGTRAAASLTIFALLAVLGGGAGWWTMGASLGAVPCIPLALATVLAILIALHRERTAVGELVAQAALTSAALPVAYASGVASTDVWPAGMAWLLAMTAGTWAVRTVIAANKGGASLAARIGAIATFALAESALIALAPWAALAAAPTVALSLVLLAAPPHPRSLRRVGWSIAAATIVAAVVMIAHAQSRPRSASTTTAETASIF